MSHETVDGSAVSEIRKLVDDAKPLYVLDVDTPDGVSVPLPLRAVGGGKYELVDIAAEVDKWRDAPRRRSGKAEVFTLQSFVDLVNRHKDDDSVVFANLKADAPGLLAVIDYHTQNHDPRFGKHTISYAFPSSEEWRAWRARVGAPMFQSDFALWVEDHIEDLASANADEKNLETLFGCTFATPADMMALARGLKINVESKVGSVVNTQTGEGQIVWEEAHKDSDGKPLKVPGLFVVSIPLFLGADPVRIVAKLRYRKEGGKLTWTYVFYRWQDVLRSALQQQVVFVEDQTKLPVYEGAPEE